VAWEAFRQVVPWQASSRPDAPAGTLAYDFLQANPATQFYPPAVNPPNGRDNPTVSMGRLMGAVRQAKARTTRYRTSRSRTGGSLRSLAFESELAKKRK
jgi:hypothetical protein